jgi:hypothetical protein
VDEFALTRIAELEARLEGLQTRFDALRAAALEAHDLLDMWATAETRERLQIALKI